MKSSLKNMVLVLFTIGGVSALLVGLVHNITKDAIAQAEEQKKNKAKFEVLSTTESEAVILEDATRKIGDFEVKVSTVASRATNEIIGYAVEAPSITANGYSDRIYLMVGFVETDGEVRINSVEVLSQKETPGLGANMTKPGNKLEKSVLGKNPATMTFKVKKDDPRGSFDALSGSTISSRAYANAMETAYAGYLWAKGVIVAKDNDATAEELIEESVVVEEESMDEEMENNMESATRKGEVGHE